MHAVIADTYVAVSPAALYVGALAFGALAAEDSTTPAAGADILAGAECDKQVSSKSCYH